MKKKRSGKSLEDSFRGSSNGTVFELWYTVRTYWLTVDTIMKNVIIYSTPSCGYCVKAKEYFAEHSVPYTEFDVASDVEKRKEMVEKSGQMGVPVILIEDEVVVGFDESRLAQILEVK